MHEFTLSPLQMKAFLAKAELSRKQVFFARNQTIFRQGDSCDSLFYIEKGTVKLTAASRQGKEAVIDILGRSDIAGDDCFNVDTPVWSCSATALNSTVAWRINRTAVNASLHANSYTSSLFLTYLGRRLARTQEELVSHLLHSTARRLARVLRALAEYRRKQTSDAVPTISQQILAEMIGSTRQRVNVLMGKFRKAGFFQDAAGDRIQSLLLGEDDVAGLVSQCVKKRHCP